MCRLKAEGVRYLSNAYLCVAVGSGWNIMNEYSVKKTTMIQPDFSRERIIEKMDSMWLYWKNRTEDVQAIANQSPTMYEYLKENIYKSLEERK